VKVILILFAGSLILLSIFFLFTKNEGVKENVLHNATPNVLVVSVCSLRRDMLSIYGGSDPNVMPNLEKFFRESSVVFKNAFNPNGWTEIMAYFDNLEDSEDLGPSVYKNKNINFNGEVRIRVPDRRSKYPTVPAFNSDENLYEKDYRKKLDYVKSQLINERVFPFYRVIHLKYLHHPLIDTFNKDSEWDYFLTDNERRRVAEIVGHPEKYPSKLPFILMLTGSDRALAMHPFVRRYSGNIEEGKHWILKGMMTNPKLLADWTADLDYEQDLEILRKIYRGNARYLDKILAEIFNFSGNEEMRKNTIIIFLSDHGEYHMERGKLTHGDSLFDEAMAVAAAISWPGATSGVIYNQQVGYDSIAKLFKATMVGKVNKDNYLQFITKNSGDALPLRDCSFTQRGLRFNNEYKYIVDIATGQRQLFNLKSDPKELQDVSMDNVELLNEMENRFWSLYKGYSLYDVHDCAPWPKSE
jgi:hypothetical protein